MRKLVLAALVAFALIGTAACSTTAPPDQVGLYYARGPVDGDKFSHCWDPGQTTDYTWNNGYVLLPISLRTWNIAPEGGDSNRPITVNSAPEPGQPSGVQVNLWMQTNFTLNTNCGTDDKDGNSPIVQFWEKVGRRYAADTPEGWNAMLNNTIVTALETTSRSVVRGYTADKLVSGLARDEVQARIAALFQTEIKRVVGGEYFCSPTFDRNTTNCGEVQILLKDVDFTNPSVQAARDEKQAAVERAAALVAEAQGKVDAANKTGELYNNAAWVELEKAKLQLQMVQECAKNPTCTVVLGSSGQVLTSR